MGGADAAHHAANQVVIADGVWTIASVEREKGNAGKLVLPQVARDIVAAQPMIDDNPHVFAGSLRGRRHQSARHRGPPCFFGRRRAGTCYNP